MKKKTVRTQWIIFFTGIMLSLCSFNHGAPETAATKVHVSSQSPRIVNIINFIRLLEPRDPKITEEVLYQTVVKQVELMNQYNLKGTFLLQYDALMNGRYRHLLKNLPKERFEIGAWLEVPQPLAENAGLKWRGSASWDSRADVDFTTGYAPADREKLVDTYMRDFKKIFGYYPKSVGCWYIDAYTLNYLYKKYGIVASCNCKDQIGTDGYTLWGGYWNQAYYPSAKNAYMPAQTAAGQIPVPVFRMLGSDPVRQYDNGIGTDRQGVVTLEPVYPFGGGDKDWVNWFFRQFVQGEPLAFGYVQAGQENSFTWEAMAKGLEQQFPLIAKLRDEKKLQVETLATSGIWFRKKFPLTPATSVTISKDLQDPDLQTVWFNSRFYRLNLIWEKGNLQFRDIHLFDENVASPYYDKGSSASQCSFFTLPFVDGHFWSSKTEKAGLVFQIEGKNGLLDMEGTKPVIDSRRAGALDIAWPLKDGTDTVKIRLDEKAVAIHLISHHVPARHWRLKLVTKTGATLPFKKGQPGQVNCRFEGTGYEVRAIQGKFGTAAGANPTMATGNVFDYITAQNNHIQLDFSRGLQ